MYLLCLSFLNTRVGDLSDDNFTITSSQYVTVPGTYIEICEKRCHCIKIFH